MIALTALILALPAAAPTPLQDVLQLIDGQSIACEVLTPGFDTVECRVEGERTTFEGRNVLEIEFGGMPDDLQRAEGFLAAQEFQNAANLFQAAGQAEGRAVLPAYAGLRHAEALLAWARFDSGRAKDAANAFQTWLATYPDHIHLVRARLGRARATALSGATDDAARQLEELASFAFEKNLGKHIEFQARLDRCHAYLSGNQAQVAEARLRDLVPEIQRVAGSPDTPPILRPRLRALLGEGQIALGDALAAKGGPGAARAYWEGLLRDRSVGSDAQAAASIGLATAARAEGKSREAQMVLARVIATVPAGPEVMARALFQLGEVCEELGDLPAAGAVYYRELVANHPNSTWAIRARKKLGG
ncbi:MAG TPA: tetratricopeptide repeat protein [Planctomycetota bacterium]